MRITMTDQEIAHPETMPAWKQTYFEQQRIVAEAGHRNAVNMAKLMAVGAAERIKTKDGLPGLARNYQDGLIYDGQGNGYEMVLADGRMTVSCELGRISRPSDIEPDATRVAREIVRDIQAGAL